MRPIKNARTLQVLFAIAATSLLATASPAHVGDHWPMSGDSLKMSYNSNGSKTKFQFKTRRQISINPTSLAQDPRSTRSTLTVRGSGVAAGTTGVMILDPSRWSRIGSDASPKGWMFKGSEYYSKGLTKIVIKSGKTDGSLQVQAKGFYWPFQITGPQDSVQVVLTIGAFAYCAEFSPDRMAEFKKNEVASGLGKVEARFALAPGDCPAVCGNGIVETDEQCDDANFFDNDTCTNECQGCNPADAEFDTTYEGIQELIFDNPVYNCTNDACHGSNMEGGLDLRAGASHASLVGIASDIEPGTVRVYPGDQDLSMLYLKLAEKTLGNVDAPGSSMPASAPALTEEHLEAIRLWIRGGAAATGVVTGTAELLGSCLPSPTPLEIPQPAVPAPSLGTQFAMPGYNLVSQTEIEGCVASYYDVSATVPPEAIVDCPGAFPGTNETGLNPGKCFSYGSNSLAQDAQSHHSIVHIYPGTAGWNDAGWGSWRCYGGPTPNAVCNPETANVCGTDGVCGSKFHPGVACLDTLTENWGAADFDSSTSPQFSGSQESTADFHYPPGVYNLLPLKGLIVWNSHAFNLTSQDVSMNAWINVDYTDDTQFPAKGLFADQWIFTQNVPPFQRKEYCATTTFPNNTHLFQLTSHTHKRGVRWRYYDAPQTPCVANGSFTSASCVPTGTMFYESYDYSDPVTMNFTPPKLYAGVPENRTIKFCAMFDNGFTNPDDVKTRSGSPMPTGNVPVGGPCAASATFCMGGVNKGLPCDGNVVNGNPACPGSTCDACTLRGGVTTEDEMFIAIGTYYTDP